MLTNIPLDFLWKGALSVAVILGIAGIHAIVGLLVAPRPLRSIPKVPTLPFLNSLFRSESIESISKKYMIPALEKRGMASLWIIGKWSVFLSDPAYIKIFMSRTDIIPKVKTSTQGKYVTDFFGAENIAVSNGEEWKRHRKVLNPAFRHTIPTQIFGECVHELFEYIDSANSRADAVDIPALMRRLTLDALGRVLFRFNFNALKNPDNDYCKFYHRTVDGLSNPFRALFPKAEPIISLFDRDAIQSLAGFNKLILGIIESRRKEIQNGLYKEEKDQHKDMLTLMIEAISTDSESGWTTEDIKNNLMVFFLAGHDTTQGSLSVAIYYLAIFPEIQELARQEVDRILGGSNPMKIPSIEDCRNMKYIDCIIKETLRIHPPAASAGPRVVEEPIDIDGVTMPKGTQLFADIYALHHSTKYWKDPQKFWPERFYPENNPPREAWMPFGGGSRICIGMQFSLTEQRVVLSMLLRNYSWRLSANSPHANGLQINGMLGILRLKDLLIQFEKRA
ncbi:uncharacterized protein VTP21DRAFT_4057 [Calcarisporiella thermophila]|uniref:uncharacterized protein n=1 Tax=Calcarisporiella thermophila TaxID=911321 RepID=UPI00374446DB